MSFFQKLAVTYWTDQVYNDTSESIEATMEVQFPTPLIDSASNYICAVERLELSGNGIYFYTPDLDDEADDDKFGFGKYSTSIIVTDSSDVPLYIYYIFGSFYNLAELLEYLNDWGTNVYDSGENNFAGLTWKLSLGGKIIIDIENEKDESDNNYEFGTSSGIKIAFTSDVLATIFGLPKDPSNYTAKKWFQVFSDITAAGPYRFQTISSRLDVGIIPTMIQLRSNLPFESDQVSQAKTNIVTDFNIVANTSTGIGYTISPTRQNQGERVDPFSGDSFTSQPASGTISQGCGSMIVYNPPERRWLNFSAPIPIYYIRLWVELVYNNPDEVRKVSLPPGGKFSIKLGFYLRN